MRDFLGDYDSATQEHKSGEIPPEHIRRLYRDTYPREVRDSKQLTDSQAFLASVELMLDRRAEEERRFRELRGDREAFWALYQDSERLDVVRLWLSKISRFPKGMPVEYFGDDAQWLAGTITDVVPQVREDFDYSGNNDPDFEDYITFYNIGHARMVEEDSISLPVDVLEAHFGRAPWLWQQWAVLRLEERLRFQEDHPRDFIEVDATQFGKMLWDQWLQDERNAKFKNEKWLDRDYYEMAGQAELEAGDNASSHRVRLSGALSASLFSLRSCAFSCFFSLESFPLSRARATAQPLTSKRDRAPCTLLPTFLRAAHRTRGRCSRTSGSTKTCSRSTSRS